MKTSITYFILAMLLISCNEEKRFLEYSQEKADHFVEMYSAEFLQDTELLRYSYHPRAQFTFGRGTSNNYRIFPRDNEIELICFSDSCELTESFNNTSLKVSNGRYSLKQDSILQNWIMTQQLVKFTNSNKSLKTTSMDSKSDLRSMASLRSLNQRTNHS